MKLEHYSRFTPFLIGVGFLLLIILAEFLIIMQLNNGKFVYTLDDPYIHLALSENIINGHYGVNNIEFSAPSTSILWPFIMSPFSSYEYTPFLVNVVVAIITVYLFTKIFNASFGIDEKRMKVIIVALFVTVLILMTNTIGLIFTGMEHSLQLLFIK